MSIYDDPSPITADVLEWLLGDDKVASKWKEMAIRLHLEPCIPPIDQNISIKRKKFDKQKLKEFMSVWKRASPQTYTMSQLIRVLGHVGCSDMVNWLILLRTGDSRKKIEIASLIDASRSTTPQSYSPYSWYSNGGGSNEDRPESSRSFNSDDRDSSPTRPLSNCSSSETLRKTMTTTTTTRTIEKRFYQTPSSHTPKTPSSFLHRRSDHARPHAQHSRGESPGGSGNLRSTPPSSSSSLKGSQVHLVSQHPSTTALSNASSISSTRTPKVVSFKDTTEEYDNDFSSLHSGESLPEILEPLPKGISMEKYFDNLISMIQDAAEDLKV